MGFSDEIVSGAPLRKPRYVLHAGAGRGKTTLAASAEDALVIPVEDGLGNLKVSAFPTPRSWDELTAMLKEVIEDLNIEPGKRSFMDKFKTLVIDSIDHVEPLIWKETCTVHKKKNIESFGYGRGYTFADDDWIKFLRALDMIRRKDIGIIVIAHSAMVNVEDAVLGTHSRFEPKLHKRIKNLVCEWADVVGYMDLPRQIVDRGEGQKTTRTTKLDLGGHNKRLLYLEDNGAFLAKNRYGFPPMLEIPKENGFAVINDAYQAAVGGDDGRQTNSNGDSKKEEDK